MNVFLDDCFFQNLYTAKSLADNGYLKAFLERCGTFSVDNEDSYEVTWESIASVFPDLFNYFNEDIELETLVIVDPLIDEFCRLCKLYEEKEGIPFGTSPLRAEAEHEVYSNFYLVGYHYDYDFCFYHKERGRGRLVVLMGCEFCGFSQLPVALANVRTALETQVRKLRKKLQIKTIPVKKAKKEKVKEAA